MATINNSDLKKNLIEGAKINIVTEAVPSELGKTVVPVMETNPKLLRICDIIKYGVCSDSTVSAIYTTPADRDFYLTACSLSLIKDATAVSNISNLQVYIGGIAINVLAIAGITLTAQNGSMSLSFPTPIKIDRDTAIAIRNSNATSTVNSVGTIIGYIVEA